MQLRTAARSGPLPLGESNLSRVIHQAEFCDEPWSMWCSGSTVLVGLFEADVSPLKFSETIAQLRS